MRRLRRNVGIYKEKGGTIGFLMQPEGMIIIDTAWKRQAENLLQLLTSKSTAPIAYVINTHHHEDHTSGNIVFKGLAGHIMAHEQSKQNQMRVAKMKGTESDQLYPDITFTESCRCDIGDEQVALHHWGPAHTDGDCIIHFQQANIVHCGDLIYNRSYPYIDKSAGASIENWIHVINRLVTDFDQETLFIFGHAGDGYDVVGGREELTAMQDYLSALLACVTHQLSQGKSKEEIMAIPEIPGAALWKGEGIHRSLTAAYEELTNV